VTRSRRRRRVKWFLLLGFLGVFAIALGIARWFFSGPRLVAFVNHVLFEGKVKGWLEVDTVDWPIGDLLGRKAHAVIRGLRIYDPRGVLVVNVPRATATIDWWTVVFPPHDVLLDDLVLEGGCAMISEYPVYSMGPKRLEMLPNGCPTVEEDHSVGPFVVGFIDAFAPRWDQIVRSAGRPGGGSTGPIVQIRRLDLKGVDLEMNMVAYRTRVDAIVGPGMMQVSARDPHKTELTFQLAPRAPHGTLDLAPLGLHFELVDIEAGRFGIFPSAKDALQVDAKVKTQAHAEVRVVGKLTGLFQPDRKTPGGVDVTIEGKHLGGEAARIFAGQLGGDDAAGTLRISGAAPAPVFAVDFRGVTLAAAPLTIDHAVGVIDSTTTRTTLDTARISGLGGRLVARGSGSITARAINELDVNIVQPFNVATNLGPVLVRRAGGSRVDGKLRVRGVPGAFLADQIDLVLGDARARGSVRLLGDELRTAGLVIEYRDATGEVAGAVRPTDKTLALNFKAAAPQAERMLRGLGSPIVADSVEAKGAVAGTFARPIITADVAAKGAPLTPRVAASVKYDARERRLDVTNFSADPLGGTAEGKASVILAAQPRVVSADVRADKLDLNQIPGTGKLIGGTASLRLQGSGTAEHPRGRIEASASSLTLQGAPIGGAELDVSFEDSARGPVAHIQHLDVGGGEVGSVHVQGSIGTVRPWPLALDQVRVTDLSLPVIPPVRMSGLDIDGKLSLDAKVAGTALRPRAEGQLAVSGFAILEALLGAGRMRFDSDADGRIDFEGEFFQGKLGAKGTLTTAPLGVDARISFTRVDLADLLPWLGPRTGAHGWATGYVDIRTRPTLHAEAHLQRVRIDFEGLDTARRSLPLTVENKDEIVVAWDHAAQRATLLKPMKIGTENGELTVTGFAGPDAMDLKLDGDVQLPLLEFFTRRYVDRAAGTLKVRIAATGSPQRPVLSGTIAIEDAAIRQRDQDTEVRIPRGLIVLNRDIISVPGENPITVDLDGQLLTASGLVQLKDWTPQRVAASVQGRLPAKLLEIVAPRLFSNTSGSAAVALSVGGTFANPIVDGTVTFDQPLSFVPRALRREIVFQTGRIRVTRREIRIAESVTGAIEEGRFVLSGGVNLTDGTPTAADLRISIDSFSYKVPDEVEVELAARLAMTWNGISQRLKLEGELDVLDGRFVKRLLPAERFLPTRTSERSEPFWTASPLLANMDLDIKISTTGSFRVDNDVAQLPLAGSVTLTGTPLRPAFDGNVRAEGDGTVTLPAAKTGKFNVTSATVNFSPVKLFPRDTPDFVLSAEAPFTDLDFNEHLVLLELRGTLSNLQWHLSTNTGLNEGQTLLLITTGRSAQDLRARIRGDTAVLERSTYSSLGVQSTAGSFSDEVIKKVSGDVISLLLEDSLRSFTGLDCARVAPGFESVQFQFCKNLGQVFIFTVDYEQGYQGWLRFRAALNYKAADNLFLVLQRWDESRVREQDAAQGAWRVQLKYRLVIP